MKNKNILFILFTISIILIIGIGTYTILFNRNTNQNLHSKSTLVIHNETKEQSVPETPTQEEPKYYAPYTGEEVTKDVLGHTPFMAVIENSKDARPQSGLSEADMVFETMAEGGIPRFIVLFQKNEPSVIGPIRSVRPYFIDIALGFGLPFAHCGGSEDALVRIQKQNLMSLNEIANGSYYWRDKERKAPHNLYTSYDKLSSLITKKNYVKQPSDILKFDSTFWSNSNINSASSIMLKLNKFYNTSYEFKDGVYFKSMDGVPSVDKAVNKPLTAKNIVIQITNIISLNDTAHHIKIDVVGSGDGYLFSNGKYIKIKWSKNAVNSQTILQDESGNAVPLSPGNTWWHIIDKNALIDIK